MNKTTRSDQTVLVVGGSSGVGLACVHQLHAEGFGQVYSSSRRGSESLATVSRFVAADVTDNASVQRLIEQVLSESGKIDTLIHCVGYVLSGPIEETSLAEAMQQFDTNFWGMVRVVQAVLPSMRASGGGSIVLISSIAGIIPLPYQAFYSASKFAMEAYAESLSFEVDAFGIRVCLVQPGDLRTPFTASRKRVAACGPGSDYYQRFQRCINKIQSLEAEGQAPERVARDIVNLLARRELPMRHLITKRSEKLGLLLRKYGPLGLYRRVIRSVFDA
ncbi:MAG TPA: short-chain dehydrogenase/reductase [Planctomycetaceae bacterium]|nr:short-chain dehydrogenase/reductase [Planctomycetaceae bacterium]